MYVYGVAVGSRFGSVGTKNVGVFIGEDVGVEGNPLSATVGACVTAMVSETLFAQPVNPPTNVVAYMSALNLSIVCMLIT